MFTEISLNQDVGIHSKYAIKMYFCFYLWAHNSKMSTPIVLKKYNEPKGLIIYELIVLWNTFWKWAHNGGRAHNKISLQPYYVLMLS